MQDPREVSYRADEHTAVITQVLAESHLKPYNIFLHADVKGKKVADLGCGDGTIARMCIDRGAEYVLGIDGKADMIQLASQMSLAYRRKIHFQQKFIEDVVGDGYYDIAVLSYLLNNAQTFEQLVRQCKSTFSLLKKGGVAVVYNNNPWDIVGGDFMQYGFRKTLTGLTEGSPILFDYRPIMTDDIVNYYFSPEQHETAFSMAGFSEFAWKPLQLPDANPFWHDYFNREHLPVICMVAKNI
ncbi:class I SAM-dependent methyltransferase [Candidatus Woesearchaeota archaeon]|nr:MAG: class I SAM-dependent methyltransferase [Candidatus Woesearchaeota archaeon]